jgi:hypothetical protein
MELNIPSYLGNVIHIPKQYITKYDQIITNFVWDNKPPKVKYKAMINSIENGGLCLQDIESKLKVGMICLFVGLFMLVCLWKRGSPHDFSTAA